MSMQQEAETHTFSHLVEFADKKEGYIFSPFSRMNEDSWIVDTGASKHICSNPNLISHCVDISMPVVVNLPDGSKFEVNKIGEVKLNENLLLKDVLFVPEFKYNLLSVGQLIEYNNLCFNFTNKNCKLLDNANNQTIAEGKILAGFSVSPFAPFFAFRIALSYIGVINRVVRMERVGFGPAARGGGAVACEMEAAEALAGLSWCSASRGGAAAEVKGRREMGSQKGE
ncbi:retinol-binding protein 4 [Striga asiatica]|uniref:Retinol-binding protein 4 n=1 Tax=Striga asiatica TaxID=4170 RepID=A0A5A7RD09_STRAF|nr:retinol-binding protein 4 [Striga asiatica]